MNIGVIGLGVACVVEAQYTRQSIGRERPANWHDSREILTLLLSDDDPALPRNNLSVSVCIINKRLGHQSHFLPRHEHVYASHSSAI
jgi:hypothetical protein